MLPQTTQRKSKRRKKTNGWDSSPISGENPLFGLSGFQTNNYLADMSEIFGSGEDALGVKAPKK
jgi:hypothetical protein